MAVGLAIPSYVHAVAWISDERGFFADEGLDARVDVMGGSAATVRSLIGGSTDVGIAGGDAALRANAAGADLVVVAGLVNRFYHRLVARRGIERAEDLRGKRIGLPFFGGPQDMAARVAVESLGLRYEQDVQVLSVGRELNRMAALARGDIDATTSQTPPSRLRELGLYVLVDLPAQDEPFPYAVVIVRRGYLEQHEARVRGFLRALCRGITLYRDDPATTLPIVQRHLSGSDTDEAARERYRVGGPERISQPPVPSVEGIARAIALIETAEVRRMSAEDLLDLRALDAVRAEGHCGGSP